MQWQFKFAIRGLWLGALVLALGIWCSATARPTTLQREIGFILMAGSVPFGGPVFLVSWWRRSVGLRRKAKLARRSVPAVGMPASPVRRRPTPGGARPALARRPASAVRPRRAA